MKDWTLDIGHWTFIILGYIILVGVIVFLIKDKNTVEENWKTATANVKTYDELLSSSKDKNAAYQLTVDQLNYAKDSILQELNSIRKQLKVKDDNVKSLQYITTTIEKTDTITLQDTIFCNKVEVDTLLSDKWYSVRMHLKYPDTVVLSPSFRSERSIIVSTKKETVNPPKKWWILRLFQKKHKVLQVDVVEKNPYTTNTESRYIEILK